MSAPAAARIGLGTAQLGLDYGVTNSAGRVPEAEARAILDLAAASGMDTIDTAHLYGDSEAVLGRCAPAAALRIVTKTPKFGGSPPGAAASRLRAAFSQSLRRLGRETVYALLLHDPADLGGPNGSALWNAMAALKDEGLVEKIGVSVYDGAEIDALLGAYPLDLVQLPWNVLDTRLVQGGQLARLRDCGVEVHARSLFLQGLLLQPPGRIPDRFAPVRSAVAALHAAFEGEGLTPLEGLLGLAFQRPEIDRFICGVAAADELHAIVSAAETGQRVQQRLRLPIMEPLDPLYLNPARWPELDQGGPLAIEGTT